MFKSIREFMPGGPLVEPTEYPWSTMKRFLICGIACFIFRAGYLSHECLTSFKAFNEAKYANETGTGNAVDLVSHKKELFDVASALIENLFWCLTASIGISQIKLRYLYAFQAEIMVSLAASSTWIFFPTNGGFINLMACFKVLSKGFIHAVVMRIIRMIKRANSIPLRAQSDLIQ